ncbi:sugar kinase [Lacihabitans sp. CCS-44]|uniref:sugar kinase n=1 Tax=Lacihabitans sp. CCS-44 TaxID=2487331 RepID=UPI0020CE6106|nr:sugar kinase [Lacihabitans sp. CCS-44]MCP9753919.1 sugar kinase [Lacihabitans sp. CCS-44]
MKKSILTFGEILLRLSPEMGGAWIRNASIPTFVGGAELNTATALASWNVPVQYCSGLPKNALAEEIAVHLESKNIDTSKMQWCGERIGIYMLPQGADLKNAGVIYDRAHSSFSSINVGQINWPEVFKGVEWLHVSAITPALSQQMADVCLEAVKEAKKADVKISVDLNYRSKLWKYGKEPIDIMPEIAQHCDLIMGNLWAANKLLGTSLNTEVEVNNATKEDYLSECGKVSREILQKFGNCKYVANTFRFDHQNVGIEYYTTIFTENKLYVSAHFKVEKVIDKVGSGDCFMAGLLYGLYNEHQPQDIIDFAAAAAIGKLNEYGDATQQKVEDVNQILNALLVNQ